MYNKISNDSKNALEKFVLETNGLYLKEVLIDKFDEEYIAKLNGALSELYNKFLINKKFNEKRSLEYPAIYKHFRGNYYAVMGVSSSCSIEDIERFCMEAEVRAIEYLKFKAIYTESEGKTVYIFKIGDVYYHLSNEVNDKIVLYKSLYDDSGIFARPYEMFLEKVENDTSTERNLVYRFQKVESYL